MVGGAVGGGLGGAVEGTLVVPERPVPFGPLDFADVVGPDGVVDEVAAGAGRNATRPRPPSN